MIKANYPRAEKAARALLFQFSIVSFPVPLDIIYKSFSNLKIKTYSWYAKIHNISLEEAVISLKSDSGCCSKVGDGYLILYNDKIDSIGHIRWTIAHELGHYILKHEERAEEEKLIKNRELYETELEIFESEANCFARELLAPCNVLYALKKFNSRDLIRWCNVSNTAAMNIFRFFNKGTRLGRVYKPNDKIVRLFNNYIYQINNERHCYRCSYYFVHSNALHCPICSYKRISKNKGDFVMKYEGFELDENSKAIICPKCKNEEVDGGDHCKICSVSLINICTNRDHDMQGDIIWECNTLADGNARYCVKCGHSTTFLDDKLLKPWEEVINGNIAKKEVAATINDPFSIDGKPLDISDDDLPF